MDSHLPPPGSTELHHFLLLEKLENHLPHLPAHPFKKDYLTAFTVRDTLAGLFLGENPFFPRPVGEEAIWRIGAEQLCK